MSYIRIGTCGFCTRQAEFFRRFRLVEIQQTFYQPPQLKTVERWREAAPESFRFALKAWQAITHPGGCPTFRKSKLSEAERRECGSFRDTPVVRSAWETTRVLARALRAEWVIFQCPPTFRPTKENQANLEGFLGWAERDQMRFGWEPRHPDWNAELVRELCARLELIHVVDPLYEDSAWGTPRYYRLHGEPRGTYRWEYRYRYSDEELTRVAEKCREAETYCLLNNDRMCDDAARLAALLGQELSQT